MTSAFRYLLACSLAASLAACAGGQRNIGPRLAPVANPSAVIATELAFARAAREQGQWTAFRQFATDNALLFGTNGAFEAQPWLKKQADPAQAVVWQPFAVWSSCDGSLAATSGGYREPEGATGNFYTVWERQDNGTYKWIFDFGIPTPLAPAEPDSISASIANCKLADKAVAADPALSLRYSADKTLAWAFQMADHTVGHKAGNGTRTLYVWAAGENGMTLVLEAAANPIAE